MDAIYARQSADKQDSISIETQIEICKREGGDERPYLIYRDKGYSGKDLQRPDFQRMLEAVRQRRISRIITYRLDRLSRSLLDFASLIELFRRYEVDFVSTQEKFDTSTPMGTAMLNIAMVFAQLERETIQSRVRDNYYSRAKGGGWLGGRAPFGFALAKQQQGQRRCPVLVEQQPAASLLRRLFASYGQELLSLSAIAARLNRQGIASPQGAAWDSSKISRILRNPVYVKATPAVYQYYRSRGCELTNPPADFVMDQGCFLYGHRDNGARKFTDLSGHYLSLGLHQGLIDDQLFLLCQRRLDGNLRFGAGNGGSGSWLSGLLRCGHCGATMRVNASRGGRYHYFICHNRSRGLCRGRYLCSAVHELENAVEQLLLEQSRRLADIDVPAPLLEPAPLKEAQAKEAVAAEQIQRLPGLALSGGELTAQYLEQRLAELEHCRRQAQLEQQELRRRASLQPLPPQPRELPQIWPRLSLPQRRQIAGLLISRLSLDDQGLSVSWRYRL